MSFKEHNNREVAKKMLKTGIVRYGSTGMISFQDKGVQAVVDYVGWHRLLNMTTVEFENFLNFQFEGIYKDFIERPYDTSDYFVGINNLIGQTIPEMITYESMGIRSEGLKFIALKYNPNEEKRKIDYSKLKLITKKGERNEY